LVIQPGCCKGVGSWGERGRGGAENPVNYGIAPKVHKRQQCVQTIAVDVRGAEADKRPAAAAARVLDDPPVPEARRAHGRRRGEDGIHEQRERQSYHGPGCV